MARDFNGTIETPAKLNLGLTVGDTRANGYRGLRTIFQSISITDQLDVRLSSTGEDELTVEGAPEVPADTDNLVLKTLDYLRGQGLSVPPLELKLNKRIPVGAGLGGGSSNAAGLIRFVLGRGFEYPRPELLEREVAFELGADVPFFLRGGTARAAGVGEQLLKLPDQSARVLVVVPEFSVATESAYELLENRKDRVNFKFYGLLKDSDKIWENISLRNDFWPVVSEDCSRLVKIRTKLKATGARVGLTGSGSAIYALFEPGSSPPPAETLEKKLTGADVYEARFVSGWALRFS